MSDLTLAMDTQIVVLLNKQILELREDVRKLDQKIDSLLKLCYETHADVKVLNEIKNTLRRDVDELTTGAKSLASEKQERAGMAKLAKALFTFKNFMIFFVGFVFAIAQHAGEFEKKFADSGENTTEYVLND